MGLARLARFKLTLPHITNLHPEHKCEQSTSSQAHLAEHIEQGTASTARLARHVWQGTAGTARHM